MDSASVKAKTCKMHEIKEVNSPKVADGMDSFMLIKYTAFFAFQILDFMTRFWTHKGRHFLECRTMKIIAYDYGIPFFSSQMNLK